MLTHTIPQEPDGLRLWPWRTACTSMRSYFKERGILIPAELAPDGVPHAFDNQGVRHYYVADVDVRTMNPYVAVFLEDVPLPFFVGVRFVVKEDRHAYRIRCAECVKNWYAAGGGQL